MRCPTWLRARDVAATLRTALEALPADARLVLVVDQLEEVFDASDAAERRALIDLVTMEAAELVVIVALRADRYGRASAFPELARRLARPRSSSGRCRSRSSVP